MKENSKIKQELMEADNKEKLVQLLFYPRQASDVRKKKTDNSLISTESWMPVLSDHM